MGKKKKGGKTKGCRVIAALCLVAASGCATLDGALTDINTGIGKYDAALAGVCPREDHSEACNVVRKKSEAAHSTFEVAVIAVNAGKEAAPYVEDALDALKSAWASIRAIFGHKPDALPPVPPPTEAPKPEVTSIAPNPYKPITYTWEEVSRQLAVNDGE